MEWNAELAEESLQLDHLSADGVFRQLRLLRQIAWLQSQDRLSQFIDADELVIAILVAEEVFSEDQLDRGFELIDDLVGLHKRSASERLGLTYSSLTGSAV